MTFDLEDPLDVFKPPSYERNITLYKIESKGKVELATSDTSGRTVDL